MINTLTKLYLNIKHPRSKDWPKVREAHLKQHPTCAVCNGSEKIEVHHIKSFHEFPDLELDPNNLITLCEAKLEDQPIHHLWLGHFGNYKTNNPDVVKDAAYFLERFKKGSSI